MIDRTRFLALAAVLLCVGATALGLFLSHNAPQPGPPSAPPPTGLLPATVTLTPTPTASPTPLPAPVIRRLDAVVDDEAATITFHLAAQVPPERTVQEVLLWYDTESGHTPRRLAGAPAPGVTLSYTLDARSEGLTRALTTTAELDYWWLVRDSAGEAARAGGVAHLGPTLQALVAPPPSPTPPPDFTWSLSETRHFRFHYMPGTAAARDRWQLGRLAEASLRRITAVLEMAFDGQMDIYFVPRIFWQGGAAYGDKVQLISYLDRNYTAIETWTYFTHEGTHALAQDLLQPKEGGPDGVLVEGLAVWASGGHYRQEPIDEWAAVIAASDQYIPLYDLRTGSFYEFQHETAYLESASFVKFLVEREGLDRFKELYGRATHDLEHDNALVQQLYGRNYEELDAEWLAYLSALDPTPQQAETWRLKVRSFDLMRRYETELDPDARVLPSTPPPEWMSDTLQIFIGRVNRPRNIVLETALIAVQERLYGGDPAGAAALLDDVEAALDAGGKPVRPSLQARAEILELLAAQDRAVLRADEAAYGATLDRAFGGQRERLAPPFIAYRQEAVRLDLKGDGQRAEGVVLLHAQTADGPWAEDGQLFAVAFRRAEDGWRMVERHPTRPELALPPPYRPTEE